MQPHFYVFIIIIITAIMFFILHQDEQFKTEFETEYEIELLHVQVITLTILMMIQIFFGLRSFNKCANCGHRRHQHDKKSLIKRGFGSICEIICDDYKRGNAPENYTHKYSDGFTASHKDSDVTGNYD